MTLSFSVSLVNDPSKAGQPAAKKQFFGESRRFAVWPIHTRFDAVEWFVADAEHRLSDLSHAEVIRQEPTLEKALEGLA
jgi:2-polyprenyl-6-methoxyphenol hydroxylase-like FAD-dependent oxidoreductase